MTAKSDSSDGDGRARVERQIEEARDVLRRPKHPWWSVRPRKLLVPVGLVVGLMLVLRKLEEDTSD